MIETGSISHFEILSVFSKKAFKKSFHKHFDFA